jgi:hypothetical protein
LILESPPNGNSVEGADHFTLLRAAEPEARSPVLPGPGIDPDDAQGKVGGFSGIP